MHNEGYLGAKVNWPAAMQETEVAGTSTAKMLSVFPSESFPKRDLSLGGSGNLGNLRPKMNRRPRVQRQRQRTLVPLVPYFT